jgi:hypothetical protein
MLKTIEVKSINPRQKAAIEELIRWYPDANYTTHAEDNVHALTYTNGLGSKCYAIWEGKKYKAVAQYSISRPNEVKEAVERCVSRHYAAVQRKAERIAEDKRRKDAYADSIKVGDLFLTSWGYDQTNLDFYKVTRRVSKYRVEIVGVAQRFDEAYGSQSGKFFPVPSEERGEKRIVSITSSGIKIGRQYGSETDANTSHYSSWGR